HDDVNRIICGLLWEMGKGKDAKVSNMISQVFGEIPNVSPLLSIASNWILFASGQNPKDYFRGREIIGRDAFNAGGWYAARDMTRWTLNQFGVLSTLAHGAIGEPGRLAEETTYEKIIGSIPGFDRVYKETNRGFYDDAMAEKVEQEAEKSVRKLKLDNLTRYYAKTRYRLNLLGEDKLSEYDRRRRATINYFFRQSYLPITQAIADAEDNGRKDEANGLRAQLAQDAQELKQLMANRTEFESKADSLMAADRIDDLVAARPLKADKVDEWKQKKAEAKKWLEDRGYSNSEIRSMLLSNSKDKPTTRKEKMNRLNRALAVTE
ncbi:MAG: hypothetical protein FWC56_06080, partial [Phycisphaerae bacterium]|nr:hypothetical protein [Phycisphaerae bacterium]